MAKKVLGIGTVLRLYEDDGNHQSFTVKDMGIYLRDHGGWEFCLDVTEEGIIDYETVRFLMNIGRIWIEGHGRMAEHLRKKDNQQ